MNDTRFFQALLGNTDPWAVEAVELDTERETVTITMGVKAGTIWGCPACQSRMHVHGWERRRWRHMDTQQFKTWIEAEVPTVRCSEHGAQQVRVPWAEPYARFTRLFEELAIALLQGMSTAAARKRLGISWDEADGIKQRFGADDFWERIRGMLEGVAGERANRLELSHSIEPLRDMRAYGGSPAFDRVCEPDRQAEQECERTKELVVQRTVQPGIQPVQSADLPRRWMPLGIELRSECRQERRLKPLGFDHVEHLCKDRKSHVGAVDVMRDLLPKTFQCEVQDQFGKNDGQKVSEVPAKHPPTKTGDDRQGCQQAGRCQECP